MPVRKEVLSRFSYTPEDERGDFKIGGGESTKFTIQDVDRKRTPLKDLEWYYWNYGPLFRSLNLKAASIWGRGFHVEIKSEDKGIIDLCTNSTLGVPGFKQWCINESLHTYIYGKGPGELIWDDTNKEDKEGKPVKDKHGFVIKEEEGKNIVGYNLTDPKTMVPKWDKQGYIEYWVQKITTKTGTQEEQKHKPRKVCHYRFHQIADSFEGIGLVETNLSTVNGLMTAKTSSRDLLFRYGVPFVHVTKTGATAREIPKLDKIGENFSSKTHLSSSEKIKVDLVGIQSKGIEVKPHFDFLQEDLAGGLGMPKAIVFFAGETVNRATLTELMTVTSIEVKTYQEKLSDILENQILAPLLIANKLEGKYKPQVVWEPLDEKGEKEILENFKLFSESISKLVQQGVYTKEQAKVIVDNKFDFKVQK